MKHLTAIVCALLLAGCSVSASLDSREASVKDTPQSRYQWMSASGSVKQGRIQDFKDSVTGCMYIFVSRRAITPRLDSMGKPMCGEVLDEH